MTSQDFLKWAELTGVRFASDIVRRIDVQRSTAETWWRLAKAGENIPIRKSFALAMSAVAHSLGPWAE